MFQQGKISLDNTDIKVIVGLIALAAFLAFAQIFIAPHTKESPVTQERLMVKDNLVTHYFGNAAMELPESWKMEATGVTFYLTNQKDGPQIIFQEFALEAGEDVIKAFEKRLEPIKKLSDRRAAEFGVTNLSEIVGRPALVLIKEERGHNYGFRVAGSYPDPHPKPPGLMISLELATPQVILRFRYLETISWPSDQPSMTYVADKQEALINWALAFIDHYQWIDDTSPQPGKFLATKFGRIEIGDNPAYQRYNLTAKFLKKPKYLYELFVSLGTLPSWTPTCGADSQKEDKRITSRFNHHSFNFSWYNGADVFFSPENPLFNIVYYGPSQELDKGHELRMKILDTLRILPDSE